MSFASDAQRKHFFANGGASGGSIPNFVKPEGHWHTMTVCGVEKKVWIDPADDEPYEPGELARITEKEDRKASEMQIMMAK